MAAALNNLATLNQDRGKPAKAEPLLRRSLAIWEKVLGPGDPDVAKNLPNLAVLYRDQGRYDEAEPLFKQSLAIGEKALGPDHPDLATLLASYASLLRKTKRKAEAVTLEAHVKQILAKNDKGPTGEASTIDFGELAGTQKAWKEKP